jgi:tetratricopeptide (TPR) repeat protein
LKQKKFSEALEFYDKCLKITRKATTLDNIAVYVNKLACLLSLERYSQVITECNNAFRLVKNYKNRNDGRHSEEELQRIKQMELRIAVRKGNALTK